MLVSVFAVSSVLLIYRFKLPPPQSQPSLPELHNSHRRKSLQLFIYFPSAFCVILISYPTQRDKGGNVGYSLYPVLHLLAEFKTYQLCLCLPKINT